MKNNNLNFLKNFISNVGQKVAQNIPEEQINKTIIKNIAQTLKVGAQIITQNQINQKKFKTNNENDIINKDNIFQIKQKIILSTLNKIQQQKSEQLQNKQNQRQNMIDQQVQICQEQLATYLQSIQNDNKVWNQKSFLYFIVTYFFDEQLYNKNYEQFKPNDNTLINAIDHFRNTITVDRVNSLIKKQVQNIQNLMKKDEKQKDYEESFDQQHFNLYFQGLKQHEYSNYFQKFELQRIQLNNQQFKDEEDFLNDLIECYEMWGNMSLIDQYRNNKQLLYWQLLDNYLGRESTINLIRKYKITDFKFFDKFDIFQFMFDSEHISTLRQQENEDEIYFYFLLVCILNLLKLNYLAINKEQKLVKLIEKIQSFKKIKFQLGYKFLLKFMIDLQEKSTLSESNDDYISKELDENQFSDECDQKSLVWLFKKWTQEQYQVSEEYINRQQLQLCIDSAQSFLILAILPEFVRFYDISEPLPYQPTDIDIGYVQQIIRGKRLYLKNPEEKEKNISYWKLLIKNIQENQNKEFEIKNKKPQQAQQQTNKELNNSSQGDLIICLTICQINLLMLQLLQKNQNETQNIDLQIIQKLKFQIQHFIKQIDCSMYQNLYRQRQFYKTLCSLFINERSIMLFVNMEVSQSKNFYETQYQSHLYKNLILSFKQEFDIRSFINKKNSRNFSLQSTDQIFETLRNEFLATHNEFLKINEQSNQGEIEKIKQKFEEMIEYYKFINRKKYETFKINLKMYITYLNLMIQQKDSSQNIRKQYKIIDPISSSQFIVYKVQLVPEGNIVALKEPLDEKNYSQKQMREITILSNLPKNDLIISYLGHQLNEKKQFQIFQEYFEGEDKKNTLYDFLLNMNKQKEPQKLLKLQIARQILEGIDYLHEHNIVHGDIKLTNILINKNYQIKIIDFSESGFMVEEIIGYTYGYDANDNFKSKYVDYYSLGVLLIKIFYNLKFIIKCDCNDRDLCKEENHYYGLIQDNIKIIDLEQKNKNLYSDIFYDQIKSLLNEQPFLRCSLKELIYLIDMESSIINNNSTENERKIYEQRYKQKYGEIIKYDKDQNDIIQKLYFNTSFLFIPHDEYEVNQNYSDMSHSNQIQSSQNGQSNTKNKNEQFGEQQQTANKIGEQKACQNKNKSLIEETKSLDQKTILKINENECIEELTIKKGLKKHNSESQLRKQNLDIQDSEDKTNQKNENEANNLQFENNVNKIVSSQQQQEFLQENQIQYIQDQKQKFSSQSSKCISLENYFIDKIDKKESYPLIVNILKDLKLEYLMIVLSSQNGQLNHTKNKKELFGEQQQILSKINEQKVSQNQNKNEVEQNELQVKEIFKIYITQVVEVQTIKKGLKNHLPSQQQQEYLQKDVIQNTLDQESNQRIKRQKPKYLINWWWQKNLVKDNDESKLFERQWIQQADDKIKLNQESDVNNLVFENNFNKIESFQQQQQESLYLKDQIQNIQDQKNKNSSQSLKYENLENYFENKMKDEKESYPLIVNILKGLKLEYRKLGVDIKELVKLNSSQKIKYIAVKLKQSSSLVKKYTIFNRLTIYTIGEINNIRFYQDQLQKLYKIAIQILFKI
ncbi:hypothetical protein ABPG74_003833 [Tetrahymena malaccensis]